MILDFDYSNPDLLFKHEYHHRDSANVLSILNASSFAEDVRFVTWPLLDVPIG